MGGRHLPTVSYGQSYQQPYSVTGFSESTVFAPLDRIVSRHILIGSLTSNSCSAALACVFVLRDEFAFSFQTFSRIDPPGKAALTRGRYVFQKKKLDIAAVQKDANLVELEKCCIFFLLIFFFFFLFF